MLTINPIEEVGNKLSSLLDQTKKDYIEIDSNKLGYICNCGDSLKIKAYKIYEQVVWQIKCDNCFNKYQGVYKPWRGYWKEKYDFGNKYSFSEDHIVSIPALPIEKLDKVILHLDCGNIELSFYDVEQMEEFFNVNLSSIKGFTLNYPFSYAVKLGANNKNIKLADILINPSEYATYDLLISDPEVEKYLQVK